MSRYKYCIVPMCTNTTVSTPEKYFFDTPRDPVIRKRWCTAMKRDSSKVRPLSSKTARHVCQDHFDLENDTENHTQHSLVGGRLKLKPGIVPHVFECQRAKVSTGVAERAAKRQRRKCVSELMESYESNEPAASNPMEVDYNFKLLSPDIKGNNFEKGIQVNLRARCCTKSTQTSFEMVDFCCQTQLDTCEAACGSSAKDSDESFSGDFELENPESQGSDFDSDQTQITKMKRMMKTQVQLSCSLFVD